MALVGSLALLVLVGMAIPFVAFVLVGIWIHRANYNARQLGAANMVYSPAWAAGCWMLIPVAWLFWLPYQAVKEIWRASVNPSDWRGAPVSPLLRWWWTSSILWIVGIVILEWARTEVVPHYLYLILAIPEGQRQAVLDQEHNECNADRGYEQRVNERLVVLLSRAGPSIHPDNWQIDTEGEDQCEEHRDRVQLVNQQVDAP